MTATAAKYDMLYPIARDYMKLQVLRDLALEKGVESPVPAREIIELRERIFAKYPKALPELDAAAREAGGGTRTAPDASAPEWASAAREYARAQRELAITQVYSKRKQSTTDAILEALDAAAVAIRDLRQDVAELKGDGQRAAATYLGVWKDDAEYNRGNMVTLNGQLWHCETERVTGRPGSSPGWRMMHKSLERERVRR